MKSGIELIADERARQISGEGWTAEHDDGHKAGEIAMAAAVYASPEPIYVHGIRVVPANSARGLADCYQYDFKEKKGYWDAWPWHDGWLKRTNRIRDLTKAGALIAAEID